MHELDHYWKCEEHNTAGNGAFNCPYVHNPPQEVNTDAIK
jgi:hypothetical protein